MKPIAFMSLTLALMLGSSAEAATYPLSVEPDVGTPAFYPSDGSYCYLNPPPDACEAALAPSTVAAAQLAPQPTVVAAVPEPEVFAMMLLGLILIGYRARRENGEKFTQ